jgi:predicted DNA-binding transcriptional regulator AlpA
MDASPRTDDTGLAADRIVREPERKAITGLSRSAWHRLVKAKKAPAPVKLSERASGTRLSDLQRWLASLSPSRATGTGDASP